MSQMQSEAEQTEENRIDRHKKENNWFFRAGETAEKIWKNKWYQWFVTILLIFALGSGAFAYRYIEQETSVDSVIEDYMQSFSGGDWQSMYEVAGAEEAGILYSIWETALSAGRTDSVDSYTYKLTGTEDGIQYYTVTYREKNSEEDKTLDIALKETGEVVYHFFKTYEITAAPLVIAGATVTVPEGISFTFDTLSSEELEMTEEDGMCVYSLPYLLEGEYEIYLDCDVVTDRAETVTVGENSRYFTWLDFELEEELAQEMEEHLTQTVLSVLSEAVEYGEMERDYGSTISETYGHDGMGDWNTLGLALSDSLKLRLTGDSEEGDGVETDAEDEEDGDGAETDAEEDEDGDEAETDTDGGGTDDEEGADAEVLLVTQLNIDSSETTTYDFVYPDSCKVQLVLECSYTASSSEIDILDPDAEEEETRTGTIHMEFVATYFVDAEEWQITDCTFNSSYTMDEAAEEETESETESET